jgi:hypothetical protein
VVRSFKRGALAAVFALSLAPLAACGAGNSAQTLKISPDSDSVTVGQIEVQNAVVLTQASGEGPATVSARLFNNGSTPQTLQGVQLGGSAGVTLTGADGGRTVTVPPQSSVLLGGKGNPSAVVDSSTESLRNGDVENAVFQFSSTGPVALQVNVVPATGDYAEFGPASLPTTQAPSPSPTPTQTDKAKGPKGKATPTGAATPTGTPTSS